MNVDQVLSRSPRRAKKWRYGRGRGSGSGKTSGRGQKGQKSRTGSHHKALFEGGQMPLVRRLPKRGFNNEWRVEYDVVNLDQLEARFESGATVDPQAIQKAGLVKKSGARIKVLARGELTKKLAVAAHKFSAQAKAKIEAAGGSVAEA